MWTDSSFATWEAEGRVKEHIKDRMHEAENWRLAKEAMQGTRNRRPNPISLSIYKIIQTLVIIAGWTKILFRYILVNKRDQTPDVKETQEAGMSTLTSDQYAV